MIYNFKDFVTKVDENVNSNEFLNKFGLTEDEEATEADAPVEEAPEEDTEPTEENAELEAFKKEHLDVMFNELSSDDFDSFYSGEFKEFKEMEDGEEKEAKKEEILTKIGEMFQLGAAEEAPEEAPEEGAEEPAAEEESADSIQESATFNLVSNLIGVVVVGDNEGVQYTVNKVTPFNCGVTEVEIKRPSGKFTYRYFKPAEDYTQQEREIILSRVGEGVKAQDPCTAELEEFPETVKFGSKPGEVPSIY